MKIRRWLTALTAALLSVALVGQLWAFAADLPWDADQKFSLTVNPCDPGGEFSEDLNEADLVVDLYKVADWDGSDLAALEPFQIPDWDAATSESWVQVAQDAAKAVLLPAVRQPDRTLDAGVQNELEAGLYLAVIHGKEETDFVTTVKNEDGEDSLATRVSTGGYVYTFRPELITVPTQVDRNWQWDVMANMKPRRDERRGNLEIVKTLLTYDTSAPATFIFQVDWDDAGQHHSSVRTVTFDQPGQRVVLAENLPVGAKVTVTEVYSGAGYKLINDQVQTVVIEPDETAQVEFINDYDGGGSGGVVINHFTYDGETESWTLEKIFDNGVRELQ